MPNVPELFGSLVFNDKVMKERLPKNIYKALKKTINEGEPLTLEVADVVANAMKDWACENGCTHFTHWFQPLTGVTAEKHDSFIEPAGKGEVIMNFSGKALVKGEPDASSFPSGGLRATFEARGYTAWDPTSYAFIKDGSLCIPTAFCGYNGEALDKKTPLLRSMDEVSKQAIRVLRLFGNTTSNKVVSSVGPEQEYFLIDKEVYKKREDLIFTGRTLFGAVPPKGQELDDHYFGSIKQRVSDYMKDLDEELWKLGILSKTKHNEVAPAQHEMAPIYTEANVATDHNQLTMEVMKKVASKHGLVCLLHEKPFAGINGSGKHNNWSLSTDDGINLFEPGKTPRDNAQFLLFLAAVIKGVDEYQDMLRLSVASAGNDHRLGANEAPPAIISIFLGDELQAVLDSIENDTIYEAEGQTLMDIGSSVLPQFKRDTTDRNRTSPFAFTGNKFEFRSLGSSFSVATPNTYLNTIVAEELEQFADTLEKADDFDKALSDLVKKTIIDHKRIIFNGNGYDESWVKEAEARGLCNLKTTPDAIPSLIAPKNVELFTKHGVYSEVEMHSRYEVKLEKYCKVINIEALTMIDMVNKYVVPATVSYQNELLDLVAKKKSLGVACPEEKFLAEYSADVAELYTKLQTLVDAEAATSAISDLKEQTLAYRDSVFAAMNDLRPVVDKLESSTGKDCWLLPTYNDIIYSVLE
jgi:glutamine synthetase